VVAAAAFGIALLGCGTPRTDEWAEARTRMVREQLMTRDIHDPRVLHAMEVVPKDRFVPEGLRARAYGDTPLPIGHGQTISQSYVVAFMTQALELDGSERVLEIGTGSGYQAAVLAECAREVFTIEIVEPLGRTAAQLLGELGYENVHARIGDGYRGWPEAAPFDAIMVTAAPDHVPQPLIDQLAPGGSMILPVGSQDQDLILVERTEQGVVQRKVLPVRFVPMTGEAEGR
jgi:protein-L-isoaspartate(D-aspartate) O-methyltransferase